MKTTNLVAVAGTMLLLAGCQSTQTQTHVKTESEQPSFEVTDHASQAVYRVEYSAVTRFSTEADQLSQSFSEYCLSSESEQATSKQMLKEQWHQTMHAWMALQGQERGPEKALEQSWNIQFWPDKKNTTGRKMSAMTKQERLWTAEEVSQESVTVQGLGAIEWLLYDPASVLGQSESVCQAGDAIAQNLSNNAEIIHRAWQENPWKSLDDKQWQAEYISMLSNQLEYSMKKMSRPLANFGKPRPYFAESWRSETSMINLEANIAALQALYQAEGNGLDRILRDGGHQQLADSITGQFELMRSTWPEDQSLFDLLQTKEGTKFAYAQFNKLEQLNYLIREEAAIELGIVIGFNATDGD
jgi:predicted lipoprotein